MDAARWRIVQDIFHAVADEPPDRQTVRLAELCGADGDLRAQVEALLAADRGPDPFLTRELPFLARQLFNDAHDPYAGRVFGPYLLKELIGQGGMGRVYLAERADYGGLVAVKVLHDSLSPERRERFAAEQRILARLVHPSIARLYDAGTLPDGTPFFAMEYVAGRSLIDHVQARALALPERLRIFGDVCRAVQYLHQHAILHHDLKPTNLLVEEDGTVKLLDFGVAEPVVSAKAEGLRPRYMTLAYAAPELVRGEVATVQADVYSLGVILHQLLTGALPFDFSDRSAGEIRKLIVEQTPGCPSAFAGEPGSMPLPRSTWRELDAICAKAMHRDPQARYSSAEALLADTERLLACRPLQACRSLPPVYRWRKFARRNVKQLAAAAAIVAVIGALTGFYTYRLAKARDAALDAAARAEAVQHLLVNLFDGEDQNTGPSNELRVVTVLDRGEQQAWKLNNQPAVQAELYQTLGSIYSNMGRNERAGILLNSALALRQQLYGRQSPETAETMLLLANLADNQDHFKEQMDWSRRALAIEKQSFPPQAPPVLKAQISVAAAMVSAGDYTRAIPLLENTLGYELGPGKPTRDLSINLNELGLAHFYLGHYALSKGFVERCRAIDKQLDGDNHPDVASDDMTLGQIEELEDDYPAAERYGREAVRIERAWFGENHFETASAITHLGQTLVHEHRNSEARDLLEEAISIRERLHQGPHAGYAVTLTALGNAERAMGNLDQAEVHFRGGLAMFNELYHGRDYRIGIVLSDLAGVEMDRRQYANAQALLDQALAIFGKTLGAHSHYLGTTQIMLGQLLLRAGQPQQAEPHLLTGYHLLLEQPVPPLEWLNRARAGLETACLQTHRAQEARAYRTEWTARDVPRLRQSAAIKKQG